MRLTVLWSLDTHRLHHHRLLRLKVEFKACATTTTVVVRECSQKVLHFLRCEVRIEVNIEVGLGFNRYRWLDLVRRTGF